EVRVDVPRPPPHRHVEAVVADGRVLRPVAGVAGLGRVGRRGVSGDVQRDIDAQFGEALLDDVEGSLAVVLEAAGLQDLVLHRVGRLGVRAGRRRGNTDSV